MTGADLEIALREEPPVQPAAPPCFVHTFGGVQIAARVLGARRSTVRRALRGERPGGHRPLPLWQRFGRIRAACATAEDGHGS